MEWLNAVIAAIVGLVSAFGGGSIIFWRLNKKLKEIENEAKQSEEWRKLYEEMKAEAKERDQKIDDLYDLINKHRDDKADLRGKVAALEVKVAKMEMTQCLVKKCPHREPPTGY